MLRCNTFAVQRWNNFEMIKKTFFLICFTFLQSFLLSIATASGFDVSFDDDDKIITVTAGNDEIVIKPVNDDCEIIDEDNNYGFSDCQITIGQLSMSSVSAQIGPDGVGFSLENGLKQAYAEFEKNF